MQWFLLSFLGVGFGVMAALPMGPVGVLIFRHTLRGRRRWALLSILGQTVAIGSYVVLVTIGLEGVLLDHPRLFHAIALVGAVLVSWLGVATLSAARRGAAATATAVQAQAPADGAGGAGPSPEPGPETDRRHVTTAFAIALTNPGVLFLLLTAVAVHGTVLGGSLRGAGLAVYLLCVLAGIEGWFLLVVALLPRLIRRPAAQRRLLGYLEWIAGALLLAFGLFLLVTEGHTMMTLLG